MGKYGKKNEVSLDPVDYSLLLIGESGIGKTTVIKNYCERLVGSDGYMFLEIGREDGGDALQGIMSEPCEDWEKFADVVDDIIENKSSDYPDLRIAVIDTCDELFAIAEPEVISMHNRDNPEKPPIRSIRQAFGGFQAGEDKVVEIILEKLWGLKRVGVSFIVIGHTKSRNVDDPVTGQSFLQLTTNMPQKYFNAIKTKVALLGVAAIDRKIISEKTGKKDIVTKKDIMKGVIKDETRKITFRDDNYVIDSKSRFAEIVPEIPLDADALVEAITDAIKAEHAKGSKPLEQTEKEQAKAKADKVKAVAEAEERNKKDRELKDVIDEITDYIKENKSNMSLVKPLLNKAKELGFANPTTIDNIKDAKAVLKLIS